MRLAQIVKMNSGVSPPSRYYGLPGEHWRFLCDLAPLGSRARDLLDEMGDFSRDVMQSLSRRMLRHSRDLANDERGMNAMDKAMAAYSDARSYERDRKIECLEATIKKLVAKLELEAAKKRSLKRRLRRRHVCGMFRWGKL